MESTAAGALFVKYATVIGGFVGSVLSLSLFKDLTRWQAAIAVAFGFCCSQFLLPLATVMLRLPSDPDSKYGVAFLIGLFAMSCVPLGKAIIMRASEKMGA